MTPAQPLWGLMGGSFNPPHRAHRALAEAALTQLGLAGLTVVPAGQPWQKPAGDLVAGEHRWAMAQLQLGDVPGVVLDRLELDRTGPSYTFDTILALKAQHPSRRWVLVLGQDQWARLPTWHRWQELLGQVAVAVAAREGQAVSTPPEVARCLEGLVTCSDDNTAARLHVLALPAWPVSSTALRRDLIQGRDVSRWMEPQVLRYIEQHGLYREPSTTYR